MVVANQQVDLSFQFFGLLVRQSNFALVICGPWSFTIECRGSKVCCKKRNPVDAQVPRRFYRGSQVRAICALYRHSQANLDKRFVRTERRIPFCRLANAFGTRRMRS